MKEEYFKDIVDESIILEAVGDKKKDEIIVRLETHHPIKDNNNHDKPSVYFNESWFQIIIGQAMHSYSQNIYFIISLEHIESSPNSLVQASIGFTILELIPQINWMLEWLHWKSTYT
jgi:hypothetical protein